MRRLTSILIGSLALIAADPAAAFQMPWRPAASAPSGDLGDLVYRATDRLIQNLRPHPGQAGMLSLSDPVIVSTIVAVDDLSASSTMGRMASQLVLSRMSQLGYEAKDVTFLRALEISPSGERILSRDARRLSKSYNAAAIVAGTYAVGGKTIWLSLRLLRAEDGAVLSSADVSIPLDADTWPLVEAKAYRLSRDPEAVLFGGPFPTTHRSEQSDEDRR